MAFVLKEACALKDPLQANRLQTPSHAAIESRSLLSPLQNDGEVQESEDEVLDSDDEVLMIGGENVPVVCRGHF